ncbi:protocatechuate 3,4-dioxygenase alpha subunit [Bradyrhizobium sp. F1.13.1]
MPQPLNYLKETASQTAGPYVHIGLIPAMAGFDIFEKNFSNVLVTPNTQGERITLEGKVIDGSGTPLRDVLLEIWQANATGRYNHPADRSIGSLDEEFRGWGRGGSDFESGLVTFETIKPGAIIDKTGRKGAPHINVWIVARGINIGLNTRLYFSDEEAANAADPVLNLIEQPIRRSTLIAKRSERAGKIVYSFTINLQGPEETVFFDVLIVSGFLAVELRAKGARRHARGGGVDPAEIGGVLEAKRIGDRRDRQIGVDEVAPRLADQPVEDQVRGGVAGCRPRHPVEMGRRDRQRARIVRNAPAFQMMLFQQRLEAAE